MRLNHRLARVFAVAFTIMAIGATALPAHAETPPKAPTTSSPQRAHAPMRLDCAHLSGSAAAYAKNHHLCPTPGQGSSGNASPNGGVVGNCGDSWIQILPTGIHGYAEFLVGADSLWGPITTVSYKVITINDDGFVNGTTGGGIPLSPDWMAFTLPVYTQPGWVTGTLYGSVTVWWGGICTFLYPNTRGDVV